MAIAYLLKKLPGTFAVACRIFVEIKYRQPDFTPKTFLDFGAGLGNIQIIQVLEVWPFKIYLKIIKFLLVSHLVL